MLVDELSSVAKVIFILLCAGNENCYGFGPNQGHCVWYGRCEQNPDNEKWYNCLYNGPAKPLQKKQDIDMLRDLCPEYIDSSGMAVTCCDGDQLKDLSKGSFKSFAYQVLNRCPACWDNFRKHYCALTCSPSQSLFMYPTEVKDVTKVSEVPSRQSITTLEFIVSLSYAKRFYTSCQNVTMTGTKVMLLFCGQDPETCTAEDFLKYMGDNPVAPFPIKVTFYEEPSVDKYGQTFHPLALPTLDCHQPVQPNGPACTCYECDLACTNKTNPVFEMCKQTDNQTITIFGFDLLVVIAVCIYVILASNFLILIVCKCFRRRRNSNQRRPTSIESFSDQGNNRRAGRSADADEHALGDDFSRSRNQKIAAWLENRIESFFFRWGYFCASHPFLVLGLGMVISLSLCFGLIFFSVVTDPIKLWAMPSSQARKEMRYFESHFEAQYRVEQVIIVPNNKRSYVSAGEKFGPVFEEKFFLEAMELQKKLESITASVKGQPVIALADVCYSPLYPDNKDCAILSVYNYFQNDYPHVQAISVNDSLMHLKECTKNPLNINCFGDFGGPIFPYIVFGGFNSKDYLNSTALTLTFLIKNYYERAKLVNVMAWESEFISYLKSYENSYMEIRFYSGRSVHDQLEEETHADIATVVLSYVLMFCYIAIGLGQINSCGGLLVDSKITLGFGGTILVSLSVLSSIGLFGYLQIPATLIVLEVVPFMVLAVGVDNIFILVQAYQEDMRLPEESREEHIGRVVSEVAPSMLLSSITDALGFFMGALSSMPAVQTFGLYAGAACVIAFMLQITSFVSLLSLDATRQENNRLDVCCCFYGCKDENIHRQGILKTLIKNVYSPLLMLAPVRILVVLLFLAWLCSSIAVLDKISVGLEQELTMSKESYVYDYLHAFKEYMAIGPPVYFVIKAGMNYSAVDTQRMICNGPGCAENSMLAHIAFAAENSESTYIAQSAESWLDDYQAWMGAGACCKEDPDTQEFCPSSSMACDHCQFHSVVVDGASRVVGTDFVHYLGYFLQDNPSTQGCFGGHAYYSTAVEFEDSNTIGATYFATYHTVLKTSKDYYEALKAARCLASELTILLNKNLPPYHENTYEVFAYSMFYVFYEQYLNMWTTTLLNLLFSSLIIFVMAFLILGMDAHLSIIIVFTVIVIVINLMGMMYWWDIQLNAISLVNLVVAIGIAVEFCSHISRAFAVSVKETKILRTKDSLTKMGTAVISGITITKFCGISVLYFAKSQIFQIYYFKINLCIVLFGAVHGLIFLPVLLSYFGPGINKRRLQKYQRQQALLLELS